MKKVALICLIMPIILFACFLYPDYDFDNPYDPKNNGGTLPYGSVQIDGDTSDWDQIPSLISDKTGEISASGNPFVPGGDIMEVKAVQDDDTIFFYMESANGSPLTETGIQVMLNLNGPDSSITPFRLDHTADATGTISNGEIEINSYYSYPIDEHNWNSITMIDPGIRFAGINQSSSAMEVGIAKALYWDRIPKTTYSISVETWYKNYEYLYGNGSLDDLSDIPERRVTIRTDDEAYPRMDSPIVNFPRGSIPIIDGNLNDLSQWSENGYWFQDMVGDKTTGGIDNMDIDKVYVKQDDENIYFLLTFADGGPPTTAQTININVQTDDGSFNHDFYAGYNGATWDTVEVQYNPSIDNTNNLAALTDGYIELQFDKTLPWSNNIPSTPLKFTIETIDSGTTIHDHVIFYGSYRADGDPTPTP